MNGEASFDLTVDGQLFCVRRPPERAGQYDLTWVSGPNPGYGFSLAASDDRELGREFLEEQIRWFLAAVDPDTGYIE